MVSTRETGQTNTLKWQLQMLLKRHNAGLKLSEEEMHLLFPYQDKDRNPEDKDNLGTDMPLTTLTSFSQNQSDQNRSVKEAVKASPASDGMTLGQRLMSQFNHLKSAQETLLLNTSKQKEDEGNIRTKYSIYCFAI